MSPDERQMLNDLFDRVRGAAATERDREAEQLIEQRLREQPYSTYYLAQAILIQDQALRATTDRIQELEAQVRDLEDQSRRVPPQQNTGFLGGLGSLFGGGQPQRADQASSRDAGSLYRDHQRASQPHPAAQGRDSTAAPSPWGRTAVGSGGPWSRTSAPGGGSFLQGAMSTAAGVAGGMLMANAVQNLFAGDEKSAANAASTENTAAAEDDAPKDEPDTEIAEAEDDGFDMFGGDDDDSFI